jgi:eukaryotic-like serine/threonine-protein kinase
MKVLRAEHLQDAAACARFARERRVPALLAHPGIVSVFDHGVLPDGRPWFTMQQVHGRGLRAVMDDLNRFRGLPSWDLALREVVESFTRIVEAMAYAHTQGVLHRDLKPENLMVGDFGEVLILDWGLARLPDSAPRHADRSMGSP